MRHSKAHAQNAVIRPPEVRLLVERQRRGVGSAAEAVARPVAQSIVLPGRKRFLHDDGGRRNPTASMKLREPVLSLQGDIAQPDDGAALAIAHYAQARRGDLPAR